MSDHIYRSPYGDLFLCHTGYKYLKREWKNGKWHYTYPPEDAIASRDVAKRASKYASEDYQLYRSTGDEKYKQKSEIMGKLTRQWISSATQLEAKRASKYRDTIKKWESTPISKIQTAYHKAADSVKKTVSKWKNALVSAFTPKETVRIITTNPGDGYRYATTSRKSGR